MIELVLWCAGFMIGFTILKFIYLVFRRLSSKNSLESVIDRMENGMANTATKVADSLKERKEKKKEQPMVTIR